MRCSSYHWGRIHPIHLLNLQALVVAGGWNDRFDDLSSVLTLIPGAWAWTPLASLPRLLYKAQASIVGGKLMVNGGYVKGEARSEVIDD